MKVRLISYTGIGHPDPLYAARLLVYTKSTRLPQGAATFAQISEMDESEILDQLEYMANTIPSSWEFVDYIFEVTEVPVSTTRQMNRTRQASIAEQSMRVTDMRNFRSHVPDTVVKKGLGGKWNALMETIAQFYRDASEAGVPAEDAREVLPLATLSSEIIKYNLRTFSELAPKRTSLRAQGNYRTVVEEMEEAIYEVHPWAKLFIRPNRNNTPFLDQLIADNMNGPATEARASVVNALKELEKLKGIH